MSVTSFHRHFRRVTSLTPIQYQRQLRLQAARSRLMSGARNIAEVGFAVGYDSPSQFSREYRRLFGRPPGADGANLRSKESDDTRLSAAYLSSTRALGDRRLSLQQAADAPVSTGSRVRSDPIPASLLRESEFPDRVERFPDRAIQIPCLILGSDPAPDGQLSVPPTIIRRIFSANASRV
jgi:AraC-like DNA-binding protein